jgi:hypothetical protein
MRFLCALLAAGLVACASRPQPVSHLADSWQQVRTGMSRDEVYELIGKSSGRIGQGFYNVFTEIWVRPDGHGQRERLAILFGSDGRAAKVELEKIP